MRRKNDYEVIDDKVALKKWKPNILIKVGVGLNIGFAALLSIPIVTLPITITAIVLNALLLIPVVDTRRYHAYWRWVPIALNIFLTLLILFIVVFSVTSLQNVLDGLVELIDKYVIFWKKFEKGINITGWLKVFEIVLLSLGCSGSVLIILGWYRGVKIGMIELTEEEQNKIAKKQAKIDAKKNN